MALSPRPVWRVEPRASPTARSGWVTRPTTGCGPDRAASRVGSANRPVPIMTTRMGSTSRFLGQLLEPGFEDIVAGDLALALGPLVVALELVQGPAGGQLADGPHLVDEQG